MWYFAYASNMNRQQLEQRVKRTSIRWMAARLDAYVIRFNKRSTVDLSGKANIVPDVEGIVWGVIFDLSEDEIERLARFEGGYSRKTLAVVAGEAAEELQAETFVAKADEPDLLPTSTYLRVIIEGAREHELPADYRERLARTKTAE
ncbi:MAG: gamma-glutamylcyclotransferase family protein [Nitrospiraceae bacterium]